MKKWISILTFIVSAVFGKDLGQKGTIFPIEEKSILDLLKCIAALHEKELKKYGEEIAKYMENPPPVAGIGKAAKTRAFFYDPTYVVEEDLFAEDILIAKKGTKINVLEEFDLPGGMLFIDGTDPSHIAWAKKQPEDFKWVLTSGSPDVLSSKENRAVFYDQLGIFTSRFQIQNVPAKIFQEKNKLRVIEVAIDDKGNPIP